MLDKVIGQADGVLGKVYDDVLHPVLQPTGEVLGFLPRSIRCLLQGWEKWIINGEESIKLTSDAIKKKIEAIPAERLTEPEPYVVVPAIQQLGYSHSSEELRELYANLIVSSMDIDKKGNVHPAFVDILKKLTPDEAKIIQFLKNNSSINYFYVSLLDCNGQTLMTRIPQGLAENVKMDVPNNSVSYLQNLTSLAIIEDNIAKEVNNDPKFKEHFERVKPAYLQSAEVKQAVYSVYTITDFGQRFIDTVS